MNTYSEAIEGVKKGSGALLDAIRAVQGIDGRVTEAGVAALAEAFSLPAAQVYEAASFYSMIRFKPAAKNIIAVCRNAPCHVAGADAVIAALESGLGIRMGETTGDGRVALHYTECIGQCQAGPAILVNGILCERVDADRVGDILRTLG